MEFVVSGTTGYDDPGLLRHAGIQDTDLSCRLSISTSIALSDHNPPTLQTDVLIASTRLAVQHVKG